VFSQESWKDKILNKKIQKRIEQVSNQQELKKALSYYLQKEWDSTLVYTTRELTNDNLTQEVQNYCFFLRGYSFQQKKLFEESKKEFEKIPQDFELYPAAKMYLGELALEKHNFQEAIQHFKETEKLDIEVLFGTKRSVIDHNIGVSYLHLEKYDLSENYLVKSVRTQEIEGDTVALIGGYGDLANLFYEQYKDDQAIPFFKKAYHLSKLIKDFNLKRRMALNMAVVEENRKDYVKALKYRKEYEQWKDSLNDQNRIYETAQLEKKIAVEQKEKEVQVLEAENKAKEAQNRVYLYSGIFLGILLIIVFISYRGTTKRNKIITAQKEDLDQLNATKDKLFSIVSHDLRSSVNAIKTSNKKLLTNLETQDQQEITASLKQNSAIVNGAYGLLDNLLNWALLQTKQTYFEMTELSLYHIVSHVGFNYQPILQDKDIAYVNSISKKTQVLADQESLKIILRNLLDNAIKFSEENGKIHIYSEETQEGYIDLVVEDSGIGMSQDTIQELLVDTQLLSKKKHEDILGTGLGLHLVKSMVAKNQGKFNIESELGKGTKIIISLQKVKTA
jgi:signal transduction histidine kinase